jgi:hypothetical protein
MTPSQLQALKAYILADPALTQHLATGRYDLVRDYYNAPSDPAFTVWRTAVTQDEIMQNGFDWTRVDNLAVGKARIWDWMFDNQSTTIDPSKTNVRAGIEAVWVGTAADLAVRAAVYVHCKRIATRVERLFATGTGSDAVPGLMGFEGEISANTVTTALEGV